MTASWPSTAQPVTNWQQAVTLIRGHGAGKATVVVERAGKQITLYPELVAVQRPPIDDPNGPKTTVGALGVGQSIAYEHPGVIAGVGDSARMFGQLFTGTFEALGKLPASLAKVFNSPQDGGRDPNGAVGVVGAADVSGRLLSADQPFSQRVAAFLLLVAGINVFVGIFNLLPLLPLDGGHLARARLRTGARPRPALAGLSRAGAAGRHEQADARRDRGDRGVRGHVRPADVGGHSQSHQLQSITGRSGPRTIDTVRCNTP